MGKQSILIHEDEDPFGPGVDLVVSLVAFLLFIVAGALMLYKQSVAESDRLRTLVKVLEKKLEDQKNQFPPNILINDSQGFEFDSGKAKVKPKLEDFINKRLVVMINEKTAKYKVDTIVVIGHTDGQRVGVQGSTLDQYLDSKEGQRLFSDKLTPASNVDLGMMRALAVVEKLRILQQRGQLPGIDPRNGFRAYSAGSFLKKDGYWAPPGEASDQERRRIEIRFLKREQDLKNTIVPDS